MSVEEKQNLILKPKEVLNLDVIFRPKTRLPQFEHNIMLQIEGIDDPRKLLTVKGVAHGIELKAMDEVVSFGNVVKGSRLTKPLQMSNFGDVKAYYNWDTKSLGKHFTIKPSSGYVNPNSNLDLDVIFHPKVVDDDLRQKVTCAVKGGEEISLSLMGRSVDQEGTQTQELNFSTVVRKATTQTVSIKNEDDKEWAINPTISTHADSCKGFFTGKATFVVPAKSSGNYEVTYTPKTMTEKAKKADSEEMEDVPHTGSLFFPLPNGTALIYNLKGLATAPESEGTITETVIAKKQKNFIVKVKNWANQTQRFTAGWEVEGADAGLFIRGANTFDVTGDSYKDYKLNFLSLKAGVFKFKLTFKAKNSSEYIFYNFEVKVDESSDVDNIELVAPIRESVSQAIVLENPTVETVVIQKSQFAFTNEYLEITPDELSLKPKEAREF